MASSGLPKQASRGDGSEDDILALDPDVVSTQPMDPATGDLVAEAAVSGAVNGAILDQPDVGSSSSDGDKVASDHVLIGSLSRTNIVAVEPGLALALHEGPREATVRERMMVLPARGLKAGMEFAGWILDGISAGIRNRVHRKIALGDEGAMKRIQAFRDWELVEQINIHVLPTLVPDDPNKDLELKEIIVSALQGEVSMEQTLDDEIARVVKLAFKYEVRPDALAEFFEDPNTIDFFIRTLLKRERKHSNTGNLSSISRSIYRNVVATLDWVVKRPTLHPVEGELEQRLLAEIRDFSRHYDPLKTDSTIASFVDDLIQRYPNYNVRDWLFAKQDLLRAMIEPQFVDGERKGRSHMQRLITKHYEAQVSGDDRRALPRFVRIHEKDFLDVYMDCAEENGLAIPPRARAQMLQDVGEAQLMKPVITISLDYLHGYVFSKVLYAAANGDRRRLHRLRGELIAEVQDLVASHAVEEGTIRIFDQDNNKTPEIRHVAFNSMPELMNILETAMESSLQVLEARPDIKNLLVDATQINPWHAALRNRWFHPDGNLIIDNPPQGPFHRFLGSLFTQKEADKGGLEHLRDVRTRVTGYFKQVNNYLDQYAEVLGIESVAFSTTVRDLNDYETLVWLATNPEPTRERFEARRKLEFLGVVHQLSHRSAEVHKEHNARFIEDHLRTNRAGFAIDKERARTAAILFTDPVDGNPEVIGITDLDKGIVCSAIRNKGIVSIDSAKEVRAVPLIPVVINPSDKANSMNCYLLHAGCSYGDSCDKGIAPEERFIDVKGLFSSFVKFLRKPEYRERDMDDILRMTIVVPSGKDDNETRANIRNVMNELYEHHASDGRAVSVDDGWETLRTLRNDFSDNNDSSATGYRHNAVPIFIPVPSQVVPGKFTFVSVEVRVISDNDLVKEKSSHHEVSHENYDVTRKCKLAPLIIPPRVYPDYYDFFSKRVGGKVLTYCRLKTHPEFEFPVTS